MRNYRYMKVSGRIHTVLHMLQETMTSWGLWKQGNWLTLQYLRKISLNMQQTGKKCLILKHFLQWSMEM